MFRREECNVVVGRGEVRTIEAARRARDNVDAFRAYVRENIQGNLVRRDVTRQPDHVDRIADLVGYPNPAAVGRPEEER